MTFHVDACGSQQKACIRQRKNLFNWLEQFLFWSVKSKVFCSLDWNGIWNILCFCLCFTLHRFNVNAFVWSNLIESETFHTQKITGVHSECWLACIFGTFQMIFIQTHQIWRHEQSSSLSLNKTQMFVVWSSVNL